MEIANASLLDEATAAAEAMTMLYRVQARRIAAAGGAPRFFVADSCFPQTIDVLRGRAEPLGIDLVVGDLPSAGFDDRMFGALVQTPDEAGRVRDLRGFIGEAKAARGPGRGRHGPAQPHAADPAGRDRRGRRVRQLAAVRRRARVRRSARRVLRDAREARPAGAGPHHRRVGRRARQSGVPHDAADPRAAHPPRQGDVQHLHGAGAAGQHGRVLRGVSRPRGSDGDRPARARAGTGAGTARSPAIGIRQLNDVYFDTLRLSVDSVDRLRETALAARINFRYRPDGTVNVALDETTDAGRSAGDRRRCLRAARAAGAAAPTPSIRRTDDPGPAIPPRSPGRRRS